MKLNKIYCMDNLYLLRKLNDECIDLIYCDILYNTGKKFKDYDDNLGTPQEAIKWYEPRLIEMKRVLKDTGSIYLQCDYRLIHYLKIKMDEIFGFNNLVNEIIWYYDNGGGRSQNSFNRKHDTILFYSKTKNFKYNIDDIRIPYKETSGYASGGIKSKTGKKYEPNKKGKNPDDVWNIPIINPMSKERVGYNTQKPKILLERIIKTSTDTNDIVADFFCGSGTTLVVAKELGRQYIGCDINQKAVEITNKRLYE